MFAVECPNLSLDQIYKSGQVFRWLKANPGKFVVTNGDRAVKVAQQKDRLIFNCSEEEFYSVWYDYFDMATDYEKMNNEVRSYGGPFKFCADFGSGVRVVKQDLFETVVSSLLFSSFGCSVPKTRALLDTLCKVYGVRHRQGMSESGRVTWYSFPNPQTILDGKSKLHLCNLGEREPHFLNLCEAAAEGWLDYDYLSQLSREEAQQFFLEFSGFSPAAVEFVLLCAFHDMQAFPTFGYVYEAIKRNITLTEFESVYNFERDKAGYLFQLVSLTELSIAKGG